LIEIFRYCGQQTSCWPKQDSGPVQGRGGLLVPGGAVVGRAGHGTRTHSQAGGDAGGVAGGPGGQPQLGAGGQGKMTSFIEFRNLEIN
jgi:hypothetical protein